MAIADLIIAMTQDNILSRSIVLPYLHHNTSHHSHNLFYSYFLQFID